MTNFFFLEIFQTISISQYTRPDWQQERWLGNCSQISLCQRFALFWSIHPSSSPSNQFVRIGTLHQCPLSLGPLPLAWKSLNFCSLSWVSWNSYIHELFKLPMMARDISNWIAFLNHLSIFFGTYSARGICRANRGFRRFEIAWSCGCPNVSDILVLLVWLGICTRRPFDSLVWGGTTWWDRNLQSQSLL